MSAEARFEIVRSDARKQWHARMVAANGATVWFTPQYARKVGAENAVALLAGAFIRHLGGWHEVDWAPNRETLLAEVRYVDLRVAS